MADVQPFRAVRYSGAAGPLSDLVAPPYDAVGEAERARFATKSPFNVVHLTLPDSAEEAGSLYRTWLDEGILVKEDAPAAWLLVENYVGPDGVARERHGILASLAAEPYGAGTILPHERIHPGIKEERLNLLRETRVHLEPIFLLADSKLPVQVPEQEPDMQANGARLWRLPGIDPGAFAANAELLIADGHHRYESAIAFGAEAGPGAARIMGLLVSTQDPGLQVFPTHRTFAGRPDLEVLREGQECPSLDDALARLADEPYTHSVAVAYRPGRAEIVYGGEGELDVELVDRHGLDGIGYTPIATDAVGAVDRGDADVAYLLRPPRVGDVYAVARRGGRMPPKSTYFFPKPLSGLLFYPVEP